MNNLNVRQDKIKEKRKQINYRDFIKEIASWENLNFHRNSGFISRYPDTDRIKGVLGSRQFEENKNNNIKEGMDYDFNMNFFDHFQILFRRILLPATINIGDNENSDYADTVLNVKNVYMSTIIIFSCENILYSYFVKENNRNIFNSTMVLDGCDNVYQSIGIIRGFNVFYSKFINNCSDIWFCTNMNGSQECMFCDGLENQSYCYQNKQYSKEEYLKIKEESLRQKDMFQKFYNNLSKQGNNYGSHDVNGNYILKSEQIENGNLLYNNKDGRNLFLVGGTEGNEKMYDVVCSGSPWARDYYGVPDSGDGDNYYCSTIITGCSNIYYSYYLLDCSFCIGCVGLQNKQFCILNKQYSKEERYELADKIFEQMDKDGILGDFFPGSINPYHFNDTLASLIEDFDKDEVIKDGYLRRDEEIKTDIPEGSDLVRSNDLNNYQNLDSKGNLTIDPEILKKIIVDERGNYYRILKMEYDFLMKYGLPLPEIHWLDRIKLGFKFN